MKGPKIPDTIFGIPVTKGTYDEAIKRLSQKPPEPPLGAPRGIDLSNYIHLARHGLYIAKERTLQSHNWYQAHEELHKQGAQMLTISQFVDYLNLLRSGTVKDGKGNQLPRPEVTNIYNDITEVRNPWRSQWLDADFKVINGVLRINYNHRTDVNGYLTPQNSEPLEKCLMKDRKPGISLEDWLDNPTTQGLPQKKVKKGNLWYWHPRKDRVAGFDAGSGGAGLDCGRGPSGGRTERGVLVAYAAKPQKARTGSN